MRGCGRVCGVRSGCGGAAVGAHIYTAIIYSNEIDEERNGMGSHTKAICTTFSGSII